MPVITDAFGSGDGTGPCHVTKLALQTRSSPTIFCGVRLVLAQSCDFTVWSLVARRSREPISGGYWCHLRLLPFSWIQRQARPSALGSQLSNGFLRLATCGDFPKGPDLLKPKIQKKESNQCLPDRATQCEVFEGDPWWLPPAPPGATLGLG